MIKEVNHAEIEGKHSSKESRPSRKVIVVGKQKRRPEWLQCVHRVRRGWKAERYINKSKWAAVGVWVSVCDGKPLEGFKQGRDRI